MEIVDVLVESAMYYRVCWTALDGKRVNARDHVVEPRNGRGAADDGPRH
jgi:hypothetical protein